MYSHSIQYFPLDYEKVIAPYISKPLSLRGSNDIVTKYEIRFKQPHKEYLKPEISHTIEHLLSHFLNVSLTNFISLHPIGCNTGFIVIVMNYDNYSGFLKIIESCMNDILLLREIPNNNLNQCARCDFHDLNGAKKEIELFLSHKNQWERVYI